MYIPPRLTLRAHVSALLVTHALHADSFFSVVLILPLAGKLSDRTGRKRNMIAGAVAIGVLGPIMLGVISEGHAVQAFFAQWCIGVFLSLFGGPMNGESFTR